MMYYISQAQPLMDIFNFLKVCAKCVKCISFLYASWLCCDTL